MAKARQFFSPGMVRRDRRRDLDFIVMPDQTVYVRRVRREPSAPRADKRGRDLSGGAPTLPWRKVREAKHG